MMDWSTAASVLGALAAVLAFIWGVWTYGSNRSKESEGANTILVTRVTELEKWKVEITAGIEKLRGEIQHVKEISDLRDTAAAERLTRMEEKLDELIDLLISVVRERG